MKHLVLLATIVIAASSFAQTPDDEKTIRKLEQDWIMHSGADKADFYIIAMGCEDGFAPQGLQVAGAGGL